MNDLMEMPSGVEVTATGINGLNTVSEIDFFNVGRQLASAEGAMQWWLGDWYNSIPWGDKYKACQEAGINYDSAMKYGEVARAFKIGTRVPNLTFKHHRMLTHSDLSVLDRKKLLQSARKGNWSSSRLFRERNIFLGNAEPAVTKRYDDAVDSLTDAVVRAMPDSASASAVTKAVNGMHKIASDLKHQFSETVDRVAEEKARSARENMKAAQERADEQYEKAVKMAAGVKAFLTKKEFQIIRACLHPDYCSHPKAGEAFDAFNKLADIKNW